MEFEKITKERIENTMKKLFTSETFLEYQFISDCQISPDGGYTAFIVKKLISKRMLTQAKFIY